MILINLLVKIIEICIIIMLIPPINIIIISIIITKIRKNKYYKSSYAKQTGYSYEEMKQNKGRKGEYNTYQNLEKIKIDKLFIHNAYIPIEYNKTTEIDIIMITHKGIYVIENKNYTGWIYGDEYDKNWCETYPKEKHYFYNPIKQNKNHIKYLNNILNTEPTDYISLIIFNQARLQKINVYSPDIYVFNTHHLQDFIQEESLKPDIYNESQMYYIYETLLPYTGATEYTKERHIKQLK